jgi:glycosyltransferase involved in cell wall biosynthesis
MRILVVTPWYPNGKSPYAGAFVERDVRMLASEHEVVVAHLVAPDQQDGGPDRVVQGGVPVHRFPMRPGKPADWMAAARQLRTLLGQSDLVHSQAATTLWPVALAFGPFRPRLPWVHTEHSSALVTPSRARGLRRLSTLLIRRSLYARPHLVVAVSGFLANAVGALRRGPIVVVPNAVDAPETTPPRPAPRSPLELVSVGGVHAGKRPDVAVRMLASLRDKGVDARLTWVGEGPLRATLDALASELGVSDRLVWAGARPPGEVSRFLAEADIFVLPTKVETFGVAVAEAIAHGRPVVVGNRGGHVDFVSPAVGELVAGDNADDYADAVIRLRARTRGLDADAIAATLGDQFRDETRLRRYDDAYAQAARASRRKGPR